MCLLVLAWRAHPRYRLVVAANRDEFHERAAAALEKWAPPADLLAGRDLRSGGTWLGVDRERRFGVVTNYRELQPPRAGAPSRGELIPAYLAARSGGSPASPADFLGALAPRAGSYSGFNLLLADEHSLWYASNRATPFARALAPGVYGLANESLDTPWPKLERVRAGFERWLQQGAPARTEALFELLADRTPAMENGAAPPGALPRDWARALSAPFVLHPEYGTRCSTLLLLEESGRLYLAERRFDPAGEASGERQFRLQPGEWP
ncbi:MAG: NRDE family protein [Gammaproteobacteria bacterium]|nr:NRDE family protein [Gammaproteobacteria bacterium]